MGEGHRTGQTPEGGDCPAAVSQQSIPMRQRHVLTWDAAGCGGRSSRYMAARSDRVKLTVRCGG